MKMEFYWSFLFLAVVEGKITNLSQSLKNSDKGFLDTRKNQYASTSTHDTETGLSLLQVLRKGEAIRRLRNL